MKIKINLRQLELISEDINSAKLLFTNKDGYVDFFNNKLGKEIYKHVIRITSDNTLFIGECVNGASVFFRQNGQPFFNYKEMSHMLRNSTMVAAYLNTVSYKRGSIRNFNPIIKHVVYVDNENCLAQVIDVNNQVLFVEMTTGEPVYNITTKTQIKRPDERNKYCVSLKHFKRDENIIKLSQKYKHNSEGSISPEVSSEEVPTNKNRMEDIFQSIMNGLNKGIPVSQTLRSNNVNFHDLRKHLSSSSKIDAIFNKQDKLRDAGILKESYMINEVVTKGEVKNFIFDLGFLLNFGLSSAVSYAIDESGVKEIKKLLSRIHKEPIVSGQTYFEVLDNISEVVNNPKTLYTFLVQCKIMMDYAESIIKVYVTDSNEDDINRKTIWLNRLEDLNKRYLHIMKKND